MNIFRSAAGYEAWLRAHLDDVVEKDIAVKHKKMAGDPFQFLRATYWRWAETIYGVCRDLKDAPHVLAVGDVTSRTSARGATPRDGWCGA